MTKEKRSNKWAFLLYQESAPEHYLEAWRDITGAEKDTAAALGDAVRRGVEDVDDGRGEVRRPPVVDDPHADALVGQRAAHEHHTAVVAADHDAAVARAQLVQLHEVTDARGRGSGRHGVRSSVDIAAGGMSTTPRRESPGAW